MYDNDLMAVSGLGEAQRIGVNVPADLSIVAWDDSPTCEFVHPPLTALTRDSPPQARTPPGSWPRSPTARPQGHVEEAPPVLTLRGSTGPAPRVPPAPGRAAVTELVRTNATAAI